MMNGLEERLGVESVEGKKYKAERQAGIDPLDIISQLI